MFKGAKRAITRKVDRLIERRFEAAETNRLNRANWRGANDQPVNVDLYTDLATLRQRATFEARRNPTVEAVINTYAKDCSGREGPMLRVISEDGERNKAAQDLWFDWCQCPDIAGKLGIVDFLRLWVRNLFQCGEFVFQKVSDGRADVAGMVDDALLGVSLRLKAIHPRRLKTPPANMGDPSIAMGVKHTDSGRPISYFIMRPLVWQVYQLDIGRYDEIGAAAIVHEFITIEDEQVRGIPWLSVSLSATADMRNFDIEVLDAARAAANQAVFWYSDNADAPFLEVNEVADVERGQQQTGPPGWKPAMLSPTQPAANYVDYRAEKQRDVGNPVGMPLNIARLDSSEHNYSGARFDGELYKRGIGCMQEWLERRVLMPLVKEVMREAELYATANPSWKYSALRRRPKGDVEFLFIWPPLPHVDPEKDAAEEETRLQNGTLTFDEACARAGKDADTQIAKAAEILKKFVAAKLPLPKWATAGLQQAGVQIGKDGSMKFIPGGGRGGAGGAGGDGEESQTEFLRKVLLAFLADKTTNDVYFNITDAVSLMNKVGVPVDPETKKNPDAAVPYLPVIAENGQPVTGEIVKDSAGDVVGGATEKPLAPEAAIDPKLQAPNNQAKGKAENPGQ